MQKSCRFYRPQVSQELLARLVECITEGMKSDFDDEQLPYVIVRGHLIEVTPAIYRRISGYAAQMDGCPTNWSVLEAWLPMYAYWGGWSGGELAVRRVAEMELRSLQLQESA